VAIALAAIELHFCPHAVKMAEGRKMHIKPGKWWWRVRRINFLPLHINCSISFRLHD